MNAYEKSIQLGLTGTDAEIVAKLKSLSSANLDASKVRLWLADNNLLTYDGESWFGSLESATLSTDLAAGVRSLKARVLSGHPIRTAEIAFAPSVLAIITGIAAAIPEIAGLVDSFYALDGGRPYKDLTLQQFTDQKAEAIVASEKDAILAEATAELNEHINPAIANGNRAAIVQALRDSADRLEAG